VGPAVDAVPSSNVTVSELGVTFENGVVVLRGGSLPRERLIAAGPTVTRGPRAAGTAGPLDTGSEVPMPDPNVRDLLLGKVDEITARMAELLDEVERVTEQLAPDRARSCRKAITMASVIVDEIRLRAYARPLDEPG
jgi:uncharacterized small protein (DUF1192 family)